MIAGSGAQRRPWFAAAFLLVIVAACDHRASDASSAGREGGGVPREVVVYCSVDVAFAEPILARFEKQFGITAHRIFDTEAGKTTGLVNRLLAERTAPRADVWWSGEIFGTMQLASAGVLAAYSPSTAQDIPSDYRDSGARWTAIGLRGRVLAFDPKRVRKEEVPHRWCDVTDARWKGRFALADPRFGTTRGHLAALLNLWGPARMREFQRMLRTNGARIADGNAHAVLLLTRGVVDLVATDTDDVMVAQRRGDSVDMVYPELACDGEPVGGTLWTPASAALVKGGPHPDAGRALLDYLVSEDVEASLARSDSGNVPVRPALRGRLGMTAPAEGRVDYSAAAAQLEAADRLAMEELLK